MHLNMHVASSLPIRYWQEEISVLRRLTKLKVFSCYSQIKKNMGEKLMNLEKVKTLQDKELLDQVKVLSSKETAVTVELLLHFGKAVFPPAKLG